MYFSPFSPPQLFSFWWIPPRRSLVPFSFPFTARYCFLTKSLFFPWTADRARFPPCDVGNSPLLLRFSNLFSFFFKRQALPILSPDPLSANKRTLFSLLFFPRTHFLPSPPRGVRFLSQSYPSQVEVIIPDTAFFSSPSGRSPFFPLFFCSAGKLTDGRHLSLRQGFSPAFLLFPSPDPSVILLLFVVE